MKDEQRPGNSTRSIISEDELDELLQTPLAAPPADFSQRVMRSVAQSSSIQSRSTQNSPTQYSSHVDPDEHSVIAAQRVNRNAQTNSHRFASNLSARKAVHGFALICGALAGLSKIAAFVFGVWYATAAG